jgi:hypothetical protein
MWEKLKNLKTWQKAIGVIAVIILMNYIFVVVIFVLIIGTLGFFSYKLISKHYGKSSDHNKAKNDPIDTLRKIENNKRIYDELMEEQERTKKVVNKPVNQEGIVCAFIQRKFYSDDLQKKEDKDFDYYEGNAIKIGYTMHDPDIRAFELRLEYGKRIFDPYIICKVNQCYEIEQKTHELLNDKLLWRKMFDVSVMEAESAIRKAVKEIDGAQIIDFECRKERSDIFSSSTDLNSYTQSMQKKLVKEGKIKKLKAG